MPLHPVLARSIETTRRTLAGVRPRHAVGLSAVVVAAFGLVGLSSLDRAGARSLSPGERITIEVVQPVEPEVVPGSVMEVGDLVDGFTGPPPRPPELTPVGWSGEEEDWSETWETAAPRSRPVEPETVTYRSADAEPPPPRRRESRWFGFDAPRRDFEAERAARRARMEAMDRRARDEREEARRRDLAWRAERERERDEARWRDADRRRDDRERDRWREDDRDAEVPSAGPYGPEVG